MKIKIEAASYGGAFDISDTAYFTRDDLDEFSEDVIEKLSDATHADMVDCYLDEDTNELELTLSYNEYEHTHKEKIDMRKIKKPKDLIKAYSHKFVEDFLWSFMADTEHEEMLKESINLSEYEYIGPATGYNKGWSLYRKIVDGKGVWVAKHQQTKEVIPINYEQVRGFEPIKLDGIKKLQKDLGDMLLPKNEFVDSDIKLTPVTYEDIKQQLEDIDTHEFLKINIDNSPNLNNTKATIIGTLVNGNEIIFYDSSYLRTQGDIDFVKEQYAKAIMKIEAMRKRGYLGVKDKSLKEAVSNTNLVGNPKKPKKSRPSGELQRQLEDIAIDGLNGSMFDPDGYYGKVVEMPANVSLTDFSAAISNEYRKNGYETIFWTRSGSESLKPTKEFSVMFGSSYEMVDYVIGVDTENSAKGKKYYNMDVNNVY